MMETGPAIFQEEITQLRRQLAAERSGREEAERRAEEGKRALYRRQAELSLLATIATAANADGPLPDAVLKVLRALAEYGGWELGHVYINAPDEPELESFASWFDAGPGRFEAFKQVSDSTRFRPGEGLPGRVLQLGAPLFVTELAQDNHSPRRPVAVACGLRSAFAFPVSPSTGGTAVLELFSTREQAPDAAFQALLPQITAQLSRVFSRHWVEQERRRTQAGLEEKVRERTETLSRAVGELNQRIEDQRKMQQSLQVHNRALDAAATGIVIADALQPGQPIIYCNPAFERLTGYRADEVLGRNCYFLQGDGTDAEAIKALHESIRSGQTCNVTIRNYRKDGEPFWNQLMVSPVRDGDGVLTHFIGIQENVSQQHEVEINLRAAKEVTEQANRELSRAARLKDEFLAAMSHELRTPLNAVLGMTELMHEQAHGPLNEQQTDMMRTIEESGRHLLNLINDVLDLSKIEAGKLELRIEDVDIDLTAQAALRFVKEHARRKHIAVSCEVDPALLTVSADPRRLKQVLVNLLSNAVKFTPERGQVGLTVIAEPGGKGCRFTVWDTGIGIAPENQPRLFRAFEQIDSRLSRNYEGSGLGLALVRRMVELHGGQVGVESAPGRGSRFSVTLPAARYSRLPVPLPAAKEASPAPAQPAASGVRVLLAEDNPANQKMLLTYLRARGHELSLAVNGEEAVRLAVAQTPDIILMDVQMPVMDGLEAIRRIRQDGRLGRTPIIALTALAMDGDRARCLAAGANHYLGKPVGLRDLATAIDEMTGKKKPATSDVAGGTGRG